jgi:predicted dehydrogenase
MGAYRVGILGCGGIARAHARAYGGRDNVTLAAGAEVDEERRGKFAAEFSVPQMYADYHELLDKVRPDVVSVCTWPPLHAEMTVAAAEAGARAVLCEKPMAVSLGECRKMLAACSRSGTRLVVGHQHRFDANANRAKALLAEGAIGELRWVYGYCGSRDLLANGTHVVDLVRFLMDDAAVAVVFGQIDRPAPRTDFGHEVEHSAIAHLYFENGARAFIEQGEMAPSPYAFDIVGDAGLICLNSPEPLRLVTASGRVPVELPRVDSYRAEVDALFAWLDGGPPHPSRGESAIQTHEALMAVYESSRLHRAVRLPLQRDDFPLLDMIRDGQVP